MGHHGDRANRREFCYCLDEILTIANCMEQVPGLKKMPMHFPASIRSRKVFMITRVLPRIRISTLFISPLPIPCTKKIA